MTWPYHGSLGDDGNPGGADANADSKPGEGKLDITVQAGGATGSPTVVTLVQDNPLTAGEDESNFVEGAGVGDFAELHISVGTTPTDTNTAGLPRTRVLVFHDKKQASAPKPGGSVTLTNAVPIASRLSSFTAEGAGTLYDHDGDGAPTTSTTGTPPIAVTVSCPGEGTGGTGTTECSVTEDSDGNVVSLTGYRISTVAAGVEITAIPERENNTWLAFGVWLTEAADGVDDGLVRDYTFGAFADGGRPTSAVEVDGSAVDGTPAGMKGKATYSGSAAGLHTTPTATSFFHADATLNANFDVEMENGTAVEGGTITGRIHNIVSGGVAVSDSIYLDVIPGTADNDNIADGVFLGRARMGTGVTNPETGNVNYPWNGTWDGNFYNSVSNDPTTTTVNETLTNPPGSVAGTFGVEHTDRMGTPIDTSDDETSSFVGGFGAHKD